MKIISLSHPYGEDLFRKEKEDWDRNVEFHISGSVSIFKDIWERQIILFVTKYIKPCRVLEIGAGAGTLAKKFLDAGFNIKCVDFSAKMAQASSWRYPDIKYICASAHKLPFGDSSFDLVVAHELLHHLLTEGLLEKSIAEIKRVLGKERFLLVIDHDHCWLSRIFGWLMKNLNNLLQVVKGPFPSLGSRNELTLARKNWVDIEKANFQVLGIRSINLFINQFFYSLKNTFTYIGLKQLGNYIERQFLPICRILEQYLALRYLCWDIMVLYKKK